MGAAGWPPGAGDDEVIEADAVEIDGDVHTPGGVWRDGFVGSRRRPGTFRSSGERPRVEPPSPTGAVWRDGMRIAQRRAATGGMPAVEPEPAPAGDRPPPGTTGHDLGRDRDPVPGPDAARPRGPHWRTARPWGGRRADPLPPDVGGRSDPPGVSSSGSYRAVDLWRDDPPTPPGSDRRPPTPGVPGDGGGRRANGSSPPRVTRPQPPQPPARGRGALVPWQDLRTTGSNARVTGPGDGVGSGPHPAVPARRPAGADRTGLAPSGPHRAFDRPPSTTPGTVGAFGAGPTPTVDGDRARASGPQPAVGGRHGGDDLVWGSGAPPAVGGGQPIGGPPGGRAGAMPGSAGTGPTPTAGGPGPRRGSGPFPAVTRDEAWRSPARSARRTGDGPAVPDRSWPDQAPGDQTAARGLRRMVVSPLDPPLARATGEVPAVPGPPSAPVAGEAPALPVGPAPARDPGGPSARGGVASGLRIPGEGRPAAGEGRPNPGETRPAPGEGRPAPVRSRGAYPPPAGPPVDLPPPPSRGPAGLAPPAGAPADLPPPAGAPVDLPLPPRRETSRGPAKPMPPPPPAPSALARWTSRTGALTGLLIALGFAWLVLVTLRPLEPANAPAGQIGATLDDALADSLLADRVQSVLGWATNVTTTLVLGGVIFRLFVAREDHDEPATDDPRPATSAAIDVIRRAAVAGMAAELTSVFVRAVAVSGMGLAAASDPRLLRYVVAGRFGSAALVRIAGLAILAGLATPVEIRRRPWPLGPGRTGTPDRIPDPDASFWGREGGGRAARPDRDRRDGPDRLRLERLACLVGGAVVLLSFALVGHPQATSEVTLPVVQCVHVLAVSTWFGGVTFLALELRQQRREGTARVSAALVARFSTVATVTVVLAASTGGVLAKSQVDSLDALLSTDYGHALIAKLSALVVPLAIGAYNRQWLVPAIVKRDEPAAWRHLRRALVVEVAFLALGVLLATAAMTSGGI